MTKPPRKLKKTIKAATKAIAVKPAKSAKVAKVMKPALKPLPPEAPPAKPMKTMAISKFKARCLAELERVRTTREPLLVTRFGKPVAQIQPPPEDKRASWIGSMKGTFEILGDIVGSISPESDWEAAR
jgi:antitoxin (DNA-binding transcriptional repressor) of toxin-antitoxin stability system